MYTQKKRLIRWMAVILCLSMIAVFGISSCSEVAPAEEEVAPAEEEVAPAEEEVGKVTISVLRPGDEEKVMQFLGPAVEEFMDLNPDIIVEPVYESWGGWIQKYPTLFEADTQPDVVFWWDNKQNDLTVKDKLVPLDDYVEESVFESIPGPAWDLVSIGEDARYYIPSSVDPFAMYYNKEVFEQAGLNPEEPPKTWEELLNAAEAITNNTDVPAIGVPGITGMEVLQEFVAHFIYQSTGSDLLDSNNQVLFNNEKGVEALEFIGELRPYMQSSTTEYGRGDLRPLLRDGEIGILFDGPWAVTVFIEKYGENLDESPIGIAEPPLAENNEKITWAGSNGWVATRQSTAEASGKLISFLMSEEQLFKHHTAYGSIPMLPYELEQDYYKLLTEYQLFGMLGKYHPTPAALYAEVEEVWQMFLVGQLNAEEVLAEAENVINKINERQGIQ